VTQGLDTDKTQLNKTRLEPAADVETHANTLESAREGAGEGGEVKRGGEGREGREEDREGGGGGFTIDPNEAAMQAAVDRAYVKKNPPLLLSHSMRSHLMDTFIYICVYVNI